MSNAFLTRSITMSLMVRGSSAGDVKIGDGIEFVYTSDSHGYTLIDKSKLILQSTNFWPWYGLVNHLWKTGNYLFLK